MTVSSTAVPRKPFGTTGLDVSALGFGCWEVGGGYGHADESAFQTAVSRALDLGVNCFDTAEGYGLGASEAALGRALGSRRDEAIVVSKFGVNYKDMPNMRDSSPERVQTSIDKCLGLLGTDHVEVYMIHWPDPMVPLEDTMGALGEVVDAGKVRFIGVSNFRVEQIEACSKVRRVDVVQYGWNLFDRRMQREILPYCHDNGIGFMAYGSLAYGLLSGTFTADMEFDATDWRSRRGNMGSITFFEALFGDRFPINIQAVDELKAIAARADRSLPQLALGWAASHADVSTALVGCRNVAELEDNVAGVGIALSADDLAEIDAVFAAYGIDTSPDYWIEDEGQLQK